MKRAATTFLTVAVMALTTSLALAADPVATPAPSSAVSAAAAATQAAAVPAPIATPIAPVAIPTTATPLHLRSSSGGATDSGGGGGSFWKLGAFAAIIAAAAWWMRRKRGALAKAAGPTRSIQVISRASVGVRTELVVVDVDGMTLLLGVTPAAVSRLAILGAGEIATAKDEANDTEEPAEPRSAIPERFGALLEGIKKATPAPRLVVADEPMPVEPQARGLLALRKR